MSLTNFVEPQPSLAWTFESSNVDYVTNLQPSAQVSPGPGQLVGSAALVTDAPTSNTAVSFPNSGTMNLGTSPVNVDLTTSNIFVEFWIYMNSGISFPCVISVGGGSWNWALAFNNTTLNPRLGMKYDANNLTSSVAITGFQTWNHVAFSFNRTSAGAGTAYIFVNGQPGGSMAVTGLTYSAAETARIGGYVDSGNYFNGYIRDLRVVQGGVVPTTNFTPLASAPFSYASPGYVPNMGTTVFTLLGQFITYVPGKYLNSMRLTQTVPSSGANNYVLWSMSSSPINIDATGITVSAWVNFNTFSGSFVSIYDSFSNVIGLSMTSALTRTGQGFSGTQQLKNATTISATNSTGTWYHVALTYDSTSVILYRNGVGSTPIATGSTGGVVITGLRVGSQANNINPSYSGYQSADCTLDDLRIYNTALTASQVQSIYTQGGAPASNFRVMPQPSLAWTFESSNVDYVTNLTPSAQVSPGPAQLVGSAGLVTNAPTSNTAVYFPGTTSTWMNLGTSTPVNFDTSLSNIFVECWVYSSRAYNPTFITWHQGASGGQENWSMYFDTAGTLYTSIWGDVAGTPTQGGTAVSSAIPQNTWTHVGFAIANTASVYKTYIYVNGAPTSTTPAAGWVPKFYAAGTTQIGGRNTSGDLTNMYIRDLRVVQGGVVPTSTFTPGAAPFSYASPGYVPSMGTTVFTLLGQFVTYNPSGKFGSSLLMGGQCNLRYNYPSAIPLDTGGATISMWLKPLAIPASGVSTWLFGSYGSSNADRIYAFIYSDGNIWFCFRSTGGDVGISTAGSTPTLGAWCHLAYVLGSNTVTLYVNGIALTPQSAGMVGLSLDTRFGLATLSGGNSPYINAEYDDLRIYNTALSASQVQSIYQAQGMPSRGVQDKTTYTSTPVATLFGTTFSPLNVRTPAPDTSVAGQTTFTSAAGNYSDQGSIALTPLTTGLTVTVKFKLNSYSTNGGVFCLVNNITTNYYQLYLSGTSGSQKASVEMTTDSTSIGAVTPGVINIGTIYTLTVVMQNNGYIYLYLDGVLYYSSTTPVTLVNRNYNIYIARERYGGMQGSLTVYDFRVINETLTSDKVLNLYNATTYNVLTPKITLTGAPLFNQLSQSAASSAVGAFSLRAVNGVTAKAVNVRIEQPVGAFTGPSGQYGTASSSSNYDPTNFPPWIAFNKILFTYFWASGANYTQGVARTSGTSTISNAVNYYGDWLQIQFPSAFVPVSYSIAPQSQAGGTAAINTPGTWYFFGSIDGSTWTLLDTRSGIPNSALLAGSYTTYNLTGVSTAYSYYRIVCNIVSLNTSFSIAEMVISTAQDFYADERGNLLTAPVIGMSLQNWLGGATGYVTKWYDQSGKGNDASQTTAALQPKIDLVNKQIDFKPSAYFNLPDGTVPSGNSNYTMTLRHNTVGTLSCMIGSGTYGTTHGVNALEWNTSEGYNNFWWGNDVKTSSLVTNSAGNIVTAKYNNTTGRTIYVNGTSIITGDTTNRNSTTIQNTIGTDLRSNQGQGANHPMNGELYYVFLFGTALSDADRTLVEALPI